MNALKTAFAAALAGLALAVASPAIAMEQKATYEMAMFDKAQADNQHIVVEVFKKGCPTCAAQQPGLKAAKEKFPKATFVTVDFNGDAAPVERFKAVKQSTIIVYKGAQEVARIVGETDSDAIVAAIGKGA
jgi:thiol-disulfide isomerase/thioredoxin